MPTDRAKAIEHRDRATELNEAWRVGAVQSRYSDDGHWYARLERFPAALFDRNGYVLFATEQDYLSAPMSIGKQISVPKPGISALPGYVCFRDIASATIRPLSEVSALEGREFLRLHRTRERDPSLVRQKKKTASATYGALACEVCGFDFAAFYGVLGDGYAECHHIQPLWQTSGPCQTTLDDLAIVCSNCHRMLHRRPWHTIDQLKLVLRKHQLPKSHKELHNL